MEQVFWRCVAFVVAVADGCEGSDNPVNRLDVHFIFVISVDGEALALASDLVEPAAGCYLPESDPGAANDMNSREYDDYQIKNETCFVNIALV